MHNFRETVFANKNISCQLIIKKTQSIIKKKYCCKLNELSEHFSGDWQFLMKKHDRRLYNLIYNLKIFFKNKLHYFFVVFINFQVIATTGWLLNNSGSSLTCLGRVGTYSNK